MTRPRKQTVDYFPHTCKHGKTMFIIEQNYGNDGYAFWFKVLELMGDTEGHYLDCKNKATWHFLVSIARVPDEIAQKLLDLLSDLEAIDQELWTNHKVVWSDNFTKGLAAAYRNRGVPLPDKPCFDTTKTGSSGITTHRKPQMKGDESKGDKPPLPPKGESNGFDSFWSAYPKKIGKGAALKKWEGLKRKGRLPPVPELIAAVERQKTWDQWQKDEGQFIPHPETWLNQGRWDDQPPEGGPQWTRGLSKQPSTN